MRGIQTVLRSGSAEDEESLPEEPIEVVTFGSYAFRNGRHVLEYDEVFEETQDKTTHCVIFMGPEGAEVHKTGQMAVDMIFEKGKKNLTYYTTPYGTIEMGIATTEVDVQEEADTLTLKIQYALSMNEEHVADCTLDLVAETRKPDAEYMREG